jgi:hypothetical protein
VTLDVFLESDDGYDREAVELALARNGVPADSTVTTADGGEASVSIDDDGSVFVIESLTPELAQILFDVARSAGLAILPADGTPTALVAGEAAVPEELEPVPVETPAQVYEALRQSVTRREEARGARSA